TSLKDVVIAMTQHPLGAACVVGEDNHLIGLITDGDVRRALQRFDDIRSLHARDIMTQNLIRITPDVALGRAAEILENRPSQISVLPVVEGESGIWLGLIRLHDIYLGAR